MKDAYAKMSSKQRAMMAKMSKKKSAKKSVNKFTKALGGMMTKPKDMKMAGY